MCGRFTLTVLLEELMEIFQLDSISGIESLLPRYNIAPGQMIPAIIAHEGQYRLGELRWGLIPAWAKDEKIGFRTINAKSETILDKPSFRDCFLRKRCIIPSDGFYEWKSSGNAKQPYRITMKDKSVFALAGLYDTWLSPDGRRISSCTILTAAANELVEGIHNRMPVILRKEAIAGWLDRSCQDVPYLMSLLKPYNAQEMAAYKVSVAVGNVKNTGAELIVEVT